MPRHIQETWVGIGFDVVVEHLPVADERGNVVHDAHGLPKTQEHTTLLLIVNEAGVQRVVRVPFAGEAKAELIRKLTGGIIVANGNGGLS